MKPYSKNSKDLHEVFQIMQSLETLGKNYQVTTTSRYENNEWIRSWDIDEMEDVK